MRGFLSLYAALVDLCFSIERSYLLSIPLLSRPPPTKSLEARQVPAVIATSEFLRRGYQACKCWMESSFAVITFTV